MKKKTLTLKQEESVHKKLDKIRDDILAAHEKHNGSTIVYWRGLRIDLKDVLA